MKHNVLLRNVDINSINNYKNTMIQVSHVFENLSKIKHENKQKTCKKIINSCMEIISLLNDITDSII